MTMITEMKKLLNPAKVYIPLTDTEYKLANVKVEEDQEVKIGQVLAEKFKGKVKLPVISSVSGKVIGFEELTDRFGKKVDHCVIENNENDDQLEFEAFEEATSSQVRKRLNEFGIETVCVDGSYTQIKFDQEVKHLVVNSIFVNEPSYSTDYSFIQENAESIAKGIKYLQTASLCDSVTLIVDKKMNEEAMTELGKAIVDKNINLVSIDPLKMKGQDIKYIKSLVKEDLNTNFLNSGVMYVNTDAAKVVFDAMQGIVPTSRQVVMSGDGIDNNAIFEARIGALLEDLVKELGGYNEVSEMVLHIGDFLTGNQVTDDKVAITLTTDAFNFQEYVETEEDVCTKCGDCNDVCPVGILPQNIMDAELRSVNHRIVELETDLCTECGLCTYVCPSKINVLEWVRRAKRRVG